MSVATQTAQSVPGWQDVPNRITQNKATHGYRVTPGGNIDQDTKKNTEDNTRRTNDGYEGKWGEGGKINVELNLWNFEHHLRTRSDFLDSWKDHDLREQLQKFMKDPNESIEYETSRMNAIGYSESGSEVKHGIKSLMKRGEKDKANEYFRSKIMEKIGSEECFLNKWLKGEIKDNKIKTQITFENIDNFLKLKSQENSATDKSLRESIQKIMSGKSYCTVEMEYEDSLKLSEGSYTMQKELSGIKSDYGQDGLFVWTQDRKDKINELVEKWYRKSGISKKDWEKEMESTKTKLIDEHNQRKQQQEIEAKKKAEKSSSTPSSTSSFTPSLSSDSGGGSSNKSSFKTLLRSSNLDTFLDNYSHLAEDSNIQKAILKAISGERTEISLSSQDDCSKLEKASTDTQKILNDLHEKGDKDKMKSFQTGRMKSIGKGLAQWESLSGKSKEEWGKDDSSRSSASTSTASSAGSSNSPQSSSASSSNRNRQDDLNFDMKDLVDTRITRYNLPELLTSYNDPELYSSNPEIQDFLYKALPPNHLKVRNMFSKLASSQPGSNKNSKSSSQGKKTSTTNNDNGELKLKLLSTLSRRLNEKDFELSKEEQNLLSRPKNKKEIDFWYLNRNQILQSSLYNWNNSHKKGDSTKLGKSNTSIPGYTRQSLNSSNMNLVQNSFDREKIKQIDQFVSSTTPISSSPSSQGKGGSSTLKDDNEWWLMDAALKSSSGYGKHGLTVSKEDKLRSLREWDNVSLDPDTSYIDNLNRTFPANTPAVTAAA
ncbi:uncharacterized protein L201_004430 [Kwoniella dendrophila CBS 6074]|uniref:Uncharacterized protein n=1 Tax=Kwoniella dendrophila CBS 6074 TaxID=1295534 RepID=A0AAX4JVP1_9TREE